MIVGASRNALIEETAPEASGQLRRRKGVLWIPQPIAISNVIAPHAAKECNEAATLALTGVVGPEVTAAAAVDFQEGVAALGVAVADANGIQGRFHKLR